MELIKVEDLERLNTHANKYYALQDAYGDLVDDIITIQDFIRTIDDIINNKEED